VRSEGFYVNEKSTDTSWDRNSDLPICSTAPELLCYRGPHIYIYTHTHIYIYTYTHTHDGNLHDKGRFVPVHDIMTFRGKRGIAPLILNLDTRGI